MSTINLKKETLKIIDGLKTVEIANEIFTIENFHVSSFRNSDKIFEAKTNDEWHYCAINKIPAWCYYENDSSNGERFGKLYNAFCLIDERQIAPKGWVIINKLPNVEIKSLLSYKYLKKYKLSEYSFDKIDSINEAMNNSSSFNAFPIGFRDQSDAFRKTDYYSCWQLKNNSKSIDLLKSHLGSCKISITSTNILEVTKIGIFYGINLAMCSPYILLTYNLGDGYFIRLKKNKT